MIRYDIGDKAVLGEPSTLNGLTFPTLERIVGKSSEEFISTTGTMVHGQFFINLFYFRDWIDEFQVVQKEKDLIQVNFTRRGPTKSEDVREIEAKVRAVMEEHCKVEWTEVEEIPKTPAGKHLYIRSLVARD